MMEINRKYIIKKTKCILKIKESVQYELEIVDVFFDIEAWLQR